MTTAVDTNVIVALWDRGVETSTAARLALEAAMDSGPLVVSPPVFAELTAGPGRDETFVDKFLDETGIQVDWVLDRAVWRAAGRAFLVYATRRRQRELGPRRILADFLIGAHALQRGYRLLTLDNRFFRGVFPGLTVLSPKLS
jgi:hypothetical protein